MPADRRKSTLRDLPHGTNAIKQRPASMLRFEGLPESHVLRVSIHAVRLPVRGLGPFVAACQAMAPAAVLVPAPVLDVAECRLAVWVFEGGAAAPARGPGRLAATLAVLVAFVLW